ncbi:unnamed protein product [Mytilus coruscus]|uniref:Reverse transcriptase domain-containing protein n=1 Tax=Mytilus coruscus TaxID=42192 RepID=A0A6J8CCW8_MYTCO|nr:unnamed protein product [Mytilus coruscus]
MIRKNTVENSKEVQKFYGRFLHLNVDINGKNSDLFNIYAPNPLQERFDFFQNIHSKLKFLNNAVVSGDFKTSLGALDRGSKTNHKEDKAVCALKSIINDNVLCDVYRKRNPDVSRFAQVYSKDKQKEKNRDYYRIQNKLQEMSAKEANGVCINMNRYEDLNSKLAEIEKIKCQGAILRSKAFWSVDGDKNTAYFLRLEKQRQQSKLISELKDNEGKVSRDTGEILDIIFNFYSNLYSCVKTNNDDKNKMLNFLSRTIDTSDYEMCESDITFDEICRSKGDKNDIKSYRSITLANVDYKIVARIMANRLKLTFTKIISNTQTCSVIGRDISDTVCSITNVIDLIDEEELETYILKTDQEKAFDRVSHDFLFSVLEKFGFGKRFRKWITIFCTNVRSSVKCLASFKFMEIETSFTSW